MSRPNPIASIAITGAAATCALGTDRHSATRAILAGATGFGPGHALESRPAADPGVGEAPEPDPPVGATTDRAERHIRRVVLDALADAGRSVEDGTRIALVLGTTLGGVRHLGAGLRTGVLDHHARLNNASVNRHALEGTGLPAGGISVSAACASGVTAIVGGALLLRNHDADLVIAGGYDPISEFSLGGFSSLRLVAPERPMPFEADREGMKVAEGYGFVVLERDADARERGARVLGWLAGSGERSDGYHLTQPMPDGSGAAEAMRSAIEGGGGHDPEWIIAHATSTPANDGAEHAAYRAALGDRLPGIPVTALKSRLGHTLGAAGALELVLGLTALEQDRLLTTAEGDTDQEAFPDLALLRGAPPERSSDRLAVLSLGFGGADACLRVNRTPTGTTDTEPVPVAITGFGGLLSGVGAAEGPALLDAGAPVPGEVATEAFEGLDDPRATRRLAQVSRLSRAAGRLALGHAGLDADAISDSDALVGSFHGAAGYSLDCYRELIEEGLDAGNPLLFAESVPNIASAQVSLGLGIRGATMTVIGSRIAALEALHLATLRIRFGLARRVLVIGADEHHPLITEVMTHAGLLGRRDGSLQGVGSGAIGLVLEAEPAAVARGATVHARIARTGLDWPARPGLRERLRSGRRLLTERPERGPLRITSGSGPITRLERAIAGGGATASPIDCELQSPAALLALVETIREGRGGAVLAADHAGGHALAAIDPC